MQRIPEEVTIKNQGVETFLSSTGGEGPDLALPTPGDNVALPASDLWHDFSESRNEALTTSNKSFSYNNEDRIQVMTETKDLLSSDSCYTLLDGEFVSIGRYGHITPLRMEKQQ